MAGGTFCEKEFWKILCEKVVSSKKTSWIDFKKSAVNS